MILSSGTAQPFYFNSGDNRLFAWLHRPKALPELDIGVVICSPFGYEAICAHRSVRTFAESLVEGGVPVLRFDYSGSGASSDLAEDVDLVQAWSADVRAAVETLRLHTGVQRVCLLGIRLGALFAGLAATECAVDSLIMVGPVLSGRKYVRELRTTQLAGIALSGGSDAEAERSASGPKALEAGGFSLSPAAQKSLGSIDLNTMPAPPVRSMLILDSDKLPSAKRWAESLSPSNIRIDYRTPPGLIEMVMTAPQFAVVPKEMVDAVSTWLTDGAKPASARASGVITASTELALRDAEQPAQASVIERPVFISGETTLFGVLTEPHAEEKRRRAIILLNPGADYHIGASRMYVSLARRWARRGYFVLRLDFGGIGDSETRSGSKVDEVFPDEAIEDIRRSIDYVRSRYAISDLTLAGLCSGAYHALRAAVADLNVDRILMVNPQNYFWKKGMTLEQIQLVEVVHNPGLYRRQIFSLQAWLRMFTGRVNVVRIMGIYLMSIWVNCEGIVKGYGRRLGLKFRHDLGGELEKIVANGVRVRFVFARGEPGIDLLKLQAGSTPWLLGEGCRVKILDAGDHIFSRKEHRHAMEDLLSEELYARADDIGSSGRQSPTGSFQQLSVK